MVTSTVSNQDLVCKTCKTLLANEWCIESRNFIGRYGKASLISTVFNIEAGELLDVTIASGRHIVRDIYCKGCKQTVGMMYVTASRELEKYKVGKFLLENELLRRVAPKHQGNRPAQ